jgi:hypothetical protein
MWNRVMRLPELTPAISNYLYSLRYVYSLPPPYKYEINDGILFISWGENNGSYKSDDAILQASLKSGWMSLVGWNLHKAVGMNEGSVYDMQACKDIAKNIEVMVQG